MCIISPLVSNAVLSNTSVAIEGFVLYISEGIIVAP